MITIALPKHLIINANHRMHWAKKAEKTKAIRWRARWAAKTSGIKRMDQAHLTVHIHWPDKRRRDEHNITPTIKAAIDGLIDAGLLPDDSGDYLTGPDLRRAEPIKGDHGVVLDFEFGPYGGRAEVRS